MRPETVARRGLIDPEWVAPLVRGPEAIAANLHPRLWTLMLFELWCRGMLDSPGQRRPAETAAVPARLREETE